MRSSSAWSDGQREAAGDSIDHPPNAHDDVVNAAAGALVAASTVPREPGILTYYRLKYEAHLRGLRDPFA